jgi:hypothetical protein
MTTERDKEAEEWEWLKSYPPGEAAAYRAGWDACAASLLKWARERPPLFTHWAHIEGTAAPAKLIRLSDLEKKLGVKE